MFTADALGTMPSSAQQNSIVTLRTSFDAGRQSPHFLGQHLAIQHLGPVTVTEINAADTLAKLTATFDTYERALAEGDVETWKNMFWDDPRAVRYGTRVSKRQYGYEQIASYRMSAKPPKVSRRTARYRIRPSQRSETTSGQQTPTGAAIPTLLDGKLRLGCAPFRVGR